MKQIFIIFLSLIIVSCSSPAERHIKNGDLLFKEKKFLEAFKEYSRAINHDSTLVKVKSKAKLAKKEALNQATILTKGIKHIDTKEFKKAINHFDFLLSQDPKDVDALYSKAFALEESGKPNEAINLYLRIIKIEPFNKTVLSSLGHLYFDQKKHNESINYFELLLKTEKKSEHAFFMLSANYKMLGDSENECKYLSLCYEIDKNYLRMLEKSCLKK